MTTQVIGGWDINNADLATAMERAAVLDYDLQRQLVPALKDLKPLPSIYYPDFIAGNQEDRANNLIPKGDKKHVRNTSTHHASGAALSHGDSSRSLSFLPFLFLIFVAADD